MGVLGDTYVGAPRFLFLNQPRPREVTKSRASNP